MPTKPKPESDPHRNKLLNHHYGKSMVKLNTKIQIKYRTYFDVGETRMSS